MNHTHCFVLDGITHPCLNFKVSSTRPTAVEVSAWMSNYIPLQQWPSTLTLSHWGRVKHICVVKLTIIGSDNGLSPGRRQAIIWTNAGILLIGPLGTNVIEILIGIQTFSFKKMHLKMSSGKWRPFCLGLNVLTSHLWIHAWNITMPLLWILLPIIIKIVVLIPLRQIAPNHENQQTVTKT